MAKAAKSALKVDKLDAIADRGYFNGSQILTCDQAQITATVPRPETSGNRKKGMFVKADFAYDAETDVYICPAGKHPIYRYTREEGGLMHRRYWQNECQRCPLQPRCTVEHPFGTLNSWMGTTHFLTRRLKNVGVEMALNVLAYNIKRMINMIGIGPLKKAIAI